MNNPVIQQARFANNYKYIIDNRGRKLNYDDPRVVHIWAWCETPFFPEMIKNIFDKRGWKSRFSGKISHELLLDAKKVCSGRECLSCSSFTGAVYKDIIENRDQDEFSIYYYLNQQGPCQNGAWPDMWNIFASRLGKQNAIFCAYTDVTNNFLGQGYRYGLELVATVILGDIFHESENVIKCLAQDKEEALMRFADETGKVVGILRRNLRAVESALTHWAAQVSKIPLLGSPAEIPRVLIFGTGEVEMIHNPVTDYFIRQGIIPKTQDLTGFIYLLSSEYYTRHAFKRGKISLKDQIKMVPFILSMYNPRTDHKEAFMAMKSGLASLKIDALRKKYHEIAKKSGLLLSDKYIPLMDISLKGNMVSTVNTFTETFQTIGEYVSSSNSGVYDGLMYLSTFNCQPAVNAQAIIRRMAAKKDIPYAAIDMEGPWLSASQTRVLEAMSVQARRYHAER